MGGGGDTKGTETPKKGEILSRVKVRAFRADGPKSFSLKRG